MPEDPDEWEVHARKSIEDLRIVCNDPANWSQANRWLARALDELDAERTESWKAREGR